MINSNIKFLNEMNDAIIEIENNCNELKAHLNSIFELDIENNKELKNSIMFLSSSIKRKEDLEDKQIILEDLKLAIETYYKNILLVYENTFIKKIKKSNQYLYELMKMIIIEFAPNENSLNNDINIDVKTYDYYNREPKTLNDHIEGFSLLYEDEISEIQNEQNKESNKEIDYFCSVCSGEEAINFCDKCNQLFCQNCFKIIEKYEKNESKKYDKNDSICAHNLQKISDIKDQNEKSKMLYLNSLNNFIKNLMIKSNYLFNSERIKSKSMNDSKIEYIKKTIFKYPILEKINDSESEINFLKSINNILINNFNINNLDSKSFCISDMDKTLLDSIEKVFRDDPNNYEYIRKNLEDLSDSESDKYYKDEAYIKLKKGKKGKEGKEKIAKNEFNNSIENMFYYVINLIPKKSISYNEKTIIPFLIDGITKQLKIEKENIYLLFGEANTFINYFIKTKKFSSMSIQEIKRKFLNEYEKIYEYKIIYESFGMGILNNKNYLDFRGNTICPNSSNNLFRGTEKYYPPYGWIGIGLKVLDKYENNNWLKDNTKSSKWAIAYYTLSSNEIGKVLKNIVTKKGLIEVNNKRKYKKHPDKQNGEDIYLTPFIDIAENSAGIILLNNKNYKIVLMAKVLINKIKETNDTNYWMLNQKYVRIYRILLKEI